MTVSQGDSKACPRCGNGFSRRAGMTDLAWRSTSYCTPRCADIARKRRDRARRKTGAVTGGWRPFGDGPAWNGLPANLYERELLLSAAAGCYTDGWMHDEAFSMYEDAWDDEHPVVQRMVTVTERNGRRANGTVKSRATTRFEEV